MRQWNGLRINDKVLYHELEYLLLKLYEYNGKKFCDLQPLTKERETLKGISIYDCIRLG